MNPVRTLGPAIAANNYKAIWVYLIAPILGALSGAGAYAAVKLPDEDDNPQAKAPSNPGSFRRWLIPKVVNHRLYIYIYIYVYDNIYTYI